MKMPVIGLCHSGNPNDMVIDLSNWMIVVSEVCRRLCIQSDDLGKISIHSLLGTPATGLVTATLEKLAIIGFALLIESLTAANPRDAS